MYARGLSTRDIEDALLECTGDPLLSHSSVSRVTEILNEEFEAFQNMDLSEYQLEYLFLDAIYESIRDRWNMKEAILCAWGICRDGRKVLLGITLGNKESYHHWKAFLLDLKNRGMQTPVSITSDGAKGLIKAIEAEFPNSLRIRCWAHKMRNLSNKVAGKDWREVKAELYEIRDARNVESARMRALEFTERWEGKYPSLVKCLKNDLEASLNHLKLPLRHRKLVRTTNLIERSFVEERRRTKTMGSCFTEKGVLKIVFSVLIRASTRWQRVRFSLEEISALKKLRKELGIEEKDSKLDKKSLQVEYSSFSPNCKRKRKRKVS